MRRFYTGSVVGLLVAVPFLWSLFQPPPPPVDKTLDAKTVSQWRPYIEWRLDNPSYTGNPFDLEASAVFVHQGSGRTITTSMFYDGQAIWAFRFTGVAEGVWTVHTFSGDDDLSGWSGRITVTPNPDAEAHGFMTAFGTKWGWQGTEDAFIPQYVMGKRPSAYLRTDGTVDTAKIDRDVQVFMDEHGFTGFHLLGTEGTDNWFDGDNPDLHVYRVMEYILQAVHAQGGANHIWLWGSDGHLGNGDADGPSLVGGPMSAVDQRNLRYLAARLGPLPGWSMGYGFDTENGWAHPDDLDAWKAFLEAHMGWDHFLGARVGYDEKGLWVLDPRPPAPPHDAAYRAPIADKYTTWLGGDYTGYTSYRPLYPRYVQAIRHRPEKPSFEEDRFRLRPPDEWAYKDYNEDLTRRSLWHSAMAGGVANVWGNLRPTPDEGGSRPYATKDQIKTYARFFEGRFLKDMTTAYEGPELRLSSADRAHHIIYRENSTAVQLNVPNLPGPQPAVAVDAKATYKETDIGPLNPGTHTWEAPYRSDWAIAIGRFEDTP